VIDQAKQLRLSGKQTGCGPDAKIDAITKRPKFNETGPIRLFMSSVIKQALLGLAGVWPLTESID